MKTLIVTLFFALKAALIALVSFVALRYFFKASDFDFLDLSKNPFGWDKP